MKIGLLRSSKTEKENMYSQVLADTIKIGLLRSSKTEKENTYSVYSNTIYFTARLLVRNLNKY